jgi:hypothetical protein
MPAATLRLLWVAAPLLSVLRKRGLSAAAMLEAATRIIWYPAPLWGGSGKGFLIRKTFLPPRSGGRKIFEFLIEWFL